VGFAGRSRSGWRGRWHPYGTISLLIVLVLKGLIAEVHDITVYQKTLRQRQARELEQLVQRREQALDLGNQAAELLKRMFGARQVMLFGSLVHGQWFSLTSDVDLAVWGLDCLVYLTAIAHLQDLSPEFKIDLVRMERCQPGLEQIILQEGLLL
jgi:uncharacterized protein